MKRMWIGLALLAVFCGLGFFTAMKMQEIHDPITQSLERASVCALEENWPQAAVHLLSARTRWERNRQLTAAVADHAPMEEIDSLFAELAIYLEAQESPHFSATCGELSALTRAMGEAHAISWWNLL